MKDCKQEGIFCGNRYELNVPSFRENKEMVGEGKEKSTKLENLTFFLLV